MDLPYLLTHTHIHTYTRVNKHTYITLINTHTEIHTHIINNNMQKYKLINKKKYIYI